MTHTREQIQEQIDRLRELRQMLPEKNADGGSNWDEVDAMIACLRAEIEDDKAFAQLKKSYKKGTASAVAEAEAWLSGKRTEDLAKIYDLSRSGAHLPDENIEADDKAIAKFDENAKDA